MKKILSFSLLLFAGNVLASESNTITFKYSMDTGNFPLGVAVTKLSDSLYETNTTTKIELTTDHALTIVTAKEDTPSEDPFIGLIVCDKQGNYFMLSLPFEYDAADKEKQEQKNLETAQIPLKVEKPTEKPIVPEKPIVYAPQKQYTFVRLSIGALALFGGYELMRKAMKFYTKNQTRKKQDTKSL